MERGKLGISISLMMFIVLLAGIWGYVPVILTAGYILIKEENIMIRKTAVFSLMVALIFSIISFVSSSLDGISMFIMGSGIFSIVALPISMIVRFISSVLGFVMFAKNVMLIVLAIISLLNKPLKLSFLDKFCEKHL